MWTKCEQIINKILILWIVKMHKTFFVKWIRGIRDGNKKEIDQKEGKMG